MNLRENYLYLRDQAYAGLQKRESSKSWIRMLEIAPWFLCSRTRGYLLQSVNVGMRVLDDIADGDRLPPPGISAVEYLEAKRDFINNPESPKDEVDGIFTYCYQLADRAGLNINRELDAFFEYFLFDAKRRGKQQVFKRKELDRAYDACDITGTIRGSLMVFGDDPEKAELLTPLGRATRKFYTLRDHEEDTRAGFVNIPSETMAMFGVTLDDLRDRFNPRARMWFHEEAQEGLRLLEEHEQMMRRERFAWRGRLVLPIAYVKPARSYLTAVLSNQY